MAGFPYLTKSEGKDKVTNRIRNQFWTHDQSLQEGYQLIIDKVYKEILSFAVRDFEEYAWSLCSLDRRLTYASYFDIHRNDKSVSIENVK